MNETGWRSTLLSPTFGFESPWLQPLSLNPTCWLSTIHLWGLRPATSTVFWRRCLHSSSRQGLRCSILRRRPGKRLLFGGRTFVIDRGRLVQSGSADDLASHPLELSVARAVGYPCLNTTELQIRPRDIRTNDGASFNPPGSLLLPTEGRTTLAFSPRDLKLERVNSRSLRIVVRADGYERIAGCQFLRFWSVHGVWRASQAEQAEQSVPMGTMKSVFIEPEHLMAFDASGRALFCGADALIRRWVNYYDGLVTLSGRKVGRTSL